MSSSRHSERSEIKEGEMENDNLVLRANPRRPIIMLVGSAVFLVFGIFMIKVGELRGYMVAGPSVFFFVVYAINIITGTPRLLLTRDGFAIQNPMNSYSYKWNEVDSFSVDFLKGLKLKTVVFTLSPNCKKRLTERAGIRAITGHEGVLPNNYGMSPENLADLMNKWRGRF